MLQRTACEPKNSADRFFETSEQLMRLRWLLGMFAFVAGGALLAGILTVRLGLWWRLTD
jgi:hypothetical protein